MFIIEKIKSEKILLSLIIFTFLLRIEVFAAPFPAVSADTPKSFSHDSEIIVKGSYFGIKKSGKAAPIRFEKFEDGNIGDCVNSTNWWSLKNSYDKEQITFNSTHQRHIPHSGGENKNIRWHGYGYGDTTHPSTGWFYRDNVGFNSTKKVFVSAWIYLDLISGQGVATQGSWQKKLMFLQAHATVHSSLPNFQFSLFTNNDIDAINFATSATGIDGLSMSSTGLPREGVWINLVAEYEDSDINVKNGSARFYISRSPSTKGAYVKASHKTTWPYPDKIITRTNSKSDFVNSVCLGYLIVNGGIESNSYWDDIYIDNSWARVEIGDKADYDFCSHREIQIPSTWSENSITIKANQGSFANGSETYLFVVDENGVASAGYGPIIWNSGVSGQLSVPNNFK